METHVTWKNSLNKLFEIFWDQVVLTNDDLLLSIHEKSATILNFTNCISRLLFKFSSISCDFWGCLVKSISNAHLSLDQVSTAWFANEECYVNCDNSDKNVKYYNTITNKLKFKEEVEFNEFCSFFADSQL